MAHNEETEWLRQARIVDALVRQELCSRGFAVNPKSFDELVASGELKAAEYKVLSMNMVKPGWWDCPPAGKKDVP